MLHFQPCLTTSLLKLGTNHLIDSILSSVDRLPLGLRKLATIIAKQVEKKFAPNSPQARRYRLMYKQPSHSRSVSVVGRSGSIVGVGGGVAVTAHSSMAAVASQGTLQSHSSSGGSSVVANSITGSPSPGVVDAETIKHHVAVRGFIFLRVICPVGCT